MFRSGKPKTFRTLDRSAAGGAIAISACLFGLTGPSTAWAREHDEHAEEAMRSTRQIPASSSGDADGSIQSKEQLLRKIAELKLLLSEVEKLARSSSSPTTPVTEVTTPAPIEHAKGTLIKVMKRIYPRNDAGLDKTFQDLDYFCKSLSYPPDVRLNTLRAITHVMSPDCKHIALSKEERLDLAADLIENVAFPIIHINQLGSEGTLACLEVRVATLYPDKYANFVAEFANFGDLHLSNNHTVNFPVESWKHERAPSRANHASRIFQIGAANLAWQTEQSLPKYLTLKSSESKEGAALQPGSIRYVVEGTRASLRHYSEKDGVTEIVFANDGRPVDRPCLDSAHLSQVSKLITNADEVIGLKLATTAQADEKGWMACTDKANFRLALENVANKKSGSVRFPLILDADFQIVPDATSARQGNFCSLVHYDPESGKADCWEQ